MMRMFKLLPILLAVLTLAILPGCLKKTDGSPPKNGPVSGQGKRLEQKDVSGKSVTVQLSKDMTEDQAYLALKEKSRLANLPVYRPQYTAGFTFSPTDPWGKLDSGREESVWYRKDDVYLRIVNNLAGDIGDARTMKIGMVNGKSAVMTVNGLVARWEEVHTVAGNNRQLSYGVEVFRGSALSRGEVIKIVKSMKPIE